MIFLIESFTLVSYLIEIVICNFVCVEVIDDIDPLILTSHLLFCKVIVSMPDSMLLNAEFAKILAVTVMVVIR